MEQVARVEALRRVTAAWRRAGEAVALVPTMGNLHAGHLSLIELARRHARRVVVSIFVNPAQFGPGEDFAAYPRTPAEDLDALEGAPCDLVFVPEEADLYPHGVARAVKIAVPGLSDVLEGAHRPGHFAGVAAVVLRLFHAAGPDVAVFGEKDYQQLQVIRYLVRDLSLGIGIRAGPTVREADGLALSSRNRYLSAGERARAPALYRELSRLQARLQAGERDFEALEAGGLEALRNAGFEPDYLAIRRLDLAPPAAADSDFAVLAAARLGATRLIDNIRIQG